MKNTIKKSCIVIAACLMIVFGFASLAEEAGSAPSDDVNIEFENVEDAIPEEIEIEVADVDEIGEEAGEQEFESAEDAFSEDEETLSTAEDAFWEDEESFSAIDAAASVIDEIENVEIVDGEETIVADSPAMGQVRVLKKCGSENGKAEEAFQTMASLVIGRIESALDKS